MMGLPVGYIDQKLERESLRSLTREFGYDIDCPVTAHEKSKITDYIVNTIMHDLKTNHAITKDYSPEIRSKLEEKNAFTVVDRGSNSYDLDFSDFSLADIVGKAQNVFSGLMSLLVTDSK